MQFDRKAAADKVGKEKLHEILDTMIRVRAFDDLMDAMTQAGHDTNQHSTRGQEASQVVATSFLRDTDYLVPYHRGWGMTIAKGLKTDRLMAEVLFKTTGYSFGRAGTQLGDREKRVMGRPGVQGAHIPVAAGIALANQIDKTDDIVLCLNGNGSTNTGNWYEGMNLAGALKVPAVYIVENNLYQITTHINEVTAVEDLGLRGIGFGMPSYIVDGQDAIMLCSVVMEAYEHARAGHGPSLIETKTFRYKGHGFADTMHYGGYRTEDEVNEWIDRDPIAILKKDLLELNMITEEEVAAMEANAQEEMKHAKEFALAGENPTTEELLMWNYTI